NAGIRLCSALPRSTVRTFDGVPIDVNVMFPPEPANGPDGDYPVVAIFSGFPSGKIGLGGLRGGFSSTTRLLDHGYAVFSRTDRGFRESCGTSESRSADLIGCAAGYTRFVDTRYEVRDAQYLLGLLADEGLIDPQRIAAIGNSAGGAKALALAMLRNRVMLPDGTLTKWKSPAGTPMQIAAAPSAPWSDLAEWFLANGSTLDYVAQAPYFGPQQRIGVLKQSQWQGAFALGQTGFYAPAGADPDADPLTWNDVLTAGGPYDGNAVAEDFVDEVTSHHSAYYIPDTVAPAPLLLNNGWNDHTTPADEGLRPHNKVRADYPQAPIALFRGGRWAPPLPEQGRRRGPARSPAERLDRLLPERSRHRAARRRRPRRRDDHDLPIRERLRRAVPRRELGPARSRRDPAPRPGAS